MEIIEKVVHHEGGEKYATKGKANTAIALAAALGGGALLSQFMNGDGLFGRSTTSDVDAVAAKQCQDALDLTKFIYEQRIDINNTRFADRQELNGEIFGLYKSQTDADFALYKGQRDNFDVLSQRISNLETKEAVNAAVEPWRAKVLQMQINGVAATSQAAVALEAERRSCADEKIVNYSNSTFYPKHIADINTKNTNTATPIYNPLCDCSLY